MRGKTLALAGVCLVALMDGACGRSGGDELLAPSPIGVPSRGILSALQSQILTPSCALSGSCHLGPQSVVQGFDLSPGHTWASTVGVSTTAYSSWNESFNGNPLPIVATNGSTSGSFLFLKIIGAPGITGTQAPEGAPPLTAIQIAAIAGWIRAGAPKD